RLGPRLWSGRRVGARPWPPREGTSAGRRPRAQLTGSRPPLATHKVTPQRNVRRKHDRRGRDRIAARRAAVAQRRSSNQMGTHGGPLNGLRVVAFTSVAAAPVCAMMLADFGAEVIKVEPPTGDRSRGWGSG